MWISVALAQDAVNVAQGAAAGGGASIMGTLMQMLPLMLFLFAVYYFTVAMPDQKRRNAHAQMVNGLRRGDKIVTWGGIIGKVAQIPEDTEIQLEVADGVRIRVMKTHVAELLTKPEPADKSGDAAKPAQGGK